MKENSWEIDSKNEFAHWFVNGEMPSEALFYDELHQLFEVIFKFGETTRLLYFNDSIEAALGDLMSDARNSDYLYRMYKVGNDLWLNSLIDVYVDGQVVSKELNYNNIESTLRLIKHPSATQLNGSNVLPIRLDLSMSKRQNSFAVGINLHSDLFFPFVLCPWKWKQRYDDLDIASPGTNNIDYKTHGFNNQELSFLNGGRLNVMLKGIKSYVDANQYLTWEHVGTEHWLGYHTMVSEEGIMVVE